MTREETKKILMAIEQLYPEAINQNVDPVIVLALWAEIFEDEDYKTVLDCLIRFARVDTKGYPPKPGQILAMKPNQYDDRNMLDLGAWLENKPDEG